MSLRSTFSSSRVIPDRSNNSASFPACWTALRGRTANQECDLHTIRFHAPTSSQSRAVLVLSTTRTMSERKAHAPALAKGLGVNMGNPNGAESLRRAGKSGVALRAAVSANAPSFASDLAPVLADIQAAGYTSLREIAADLAARGFLTRRDGNWRVGNVKTLLIRAARFDRFR